MSGEGPGEPPVDEDGFMLLEGWMVGAMMYAPAIEHIESNPPANDNDGEG